VDDWDDLDDWDDDEVGGGLCSGSEHRDKEYENWKMWKSENELDSYV